MINKSENIRTDYEIVVLEGQKISDVFHEIGLPTRPTGKRTVNIEMYTDEVMDDNTVESVVRIVESELYDWGFLDKDIEHNTISVVIKSKEFKLCIYTE